MDKEHRKKSILLEACFAASTIETYRKLLDHAPHLGALHSEAAKVIDTQRKRLQTSENDLRALGAEPWAPDEPQCTCASGPVGATQCKVHNPQ